MRETRGECVFAPYFDTTGAVGEVAAFKMSSKPYYFSHHTFDIRPLTRVKFEGKVTRWWLAKKTDDFLILKKHPFLFPSRVSGCRVGHQYSSKCPDIRYSEVYLHPWNQLPGLERDKVGRMLRTVRLLSRGCSLNSIRSAWVWNQSPTEHYLPWHDTTAEFNPPQRQLGAGEEEEGKQSWRLHSAGIKDWALLQCYWVLKKVLATLCTTPPAPPSTPLHSTYCTCCLCIDFQRWPANLNAEKRTLSRKDE